jgi:DNA repair protein RadD
MVSLRDYQEDFIQELRKAIRAGYKSICAVLPTGAGKTIVTGFMIERSIKEKNLNCWFIVHRNELITQTAAKFDLFNLDYGFITAKEKFKSAKLQLCMNLTLLKRIDTIPEADLPDIVYIDEAHHCKANTYQVLIAKLKEKKPNLIIIGLTATPKRLDGKGLADCFQIIVEGPKVKDLMAQKALAKYKIFAWPNKMDYKKIKSKFGDYDSQETANQIEKADIFGDLVWNYRRYLDGKKMIVFAQNVAHAKKIKEIYNNAGIPADHLDGTMSDYDRKTIVERFKTGEIKVIVNVYLISEGFDTPECAGVQLVRKTKSEALYLQMVGRALRPEPDKEYSIILDHCQNWEENGFPDDDRTWLLEYPKKKKSDHVAPTKRCFYCFAINHVSARACSECDHIFPKPDTKEKKAIGGDLVYIDKDGIRRQFANKEEKNYYIKTQMRICKTEQDFKNLALAVGYKPSWGYVQYQIRIKKSKGNFYGIKQGWNSTF